MDKKRIKRGKEDYLRIIHEFYRNGVRNIDIASELNINKASVSEMLKKLAKENLISFQPYSKVFLTNKGQKQARKISYKHFIIKKFMEKFLKHNEELASSEAHKLEHALSEESIKIIGEILKLENYHQNFEIPGYVG